MCSINKRANLVEHRVKVVAFERQIENKRMVMVLKRKKGKVKENKRKHVKRIKPLQKWTGGESAYSLRLCYLP
jgi:hypothetical protein